MKSKQAIKFISTENHDHFALSIIDKLNIEVEKRTAYKKFDLIKHSIGAKIIWVEWATRPAHIISQIKRPWQKLVVRLHRFELYRPWMEKIKWKNVDCVIFVNSEVERQFIETVSDSVNTITIPNAVEIESFPIKNPNSANSLLAYGIEFHPVKAYDKLIRMFAKVIEQNPSFTLTIAGRKPEQDIYKRHYDDCYTLINEHGLLNHIKLEELVVGVEELKTHANILSLLKTHNAIISYSDMESFHYAFAEGLASGLQGFCRGWRELNPHEFWSDWCYPDELSMIDGIIKWGEMPVEDRIIQGLKNGDYIRRKFSSEIVARQYEDLFSQ